MTSVAIPLWIEPVSADFPCGLNLEYSPEYMALISALLPQEEVQYGDFINTPEGPNWSDIERQCRTLLTQTKDISLLIIWLRARTRLSGVTGLQEGLHVLVQLLQHFADDIHPLPTIDGEFDLSMRANALSQLSDPEGLLKDILDVTFSRAQRPLSLRDIERSFAIPQPADALPSDSVKQQIIDLYHHNDHDMHCLLTIAEHIQSVETWAQQHLPDMPVNLQKLSALFSVFTHIINTIPEPITTTSTQESIDPPAAHIMETTITPTPSITTTMSVSSRQQATESLQKIRVWFEENEPSSPVSVLLWQAEKMIGKRFYEVAQCIPLDVLARWENDIKQS